MPSKKGVTLKEVARRAGCSVTAVSKTLNHARGSAAVGERKRQQILEIANELGYSPNYHARSLQTGRAQTLGLLLRRNKYSFFWEQLVQGIEHAACQANHNLLIIGPSERQDEIDQGLTYLSEHRIDALIVPAAIYILQLSRLQQAFAPVVLAGGRQVNPLPTIQIDLRPGVTQAVAHLAGLGHREILWVDTSKPPEALPQQDRRGALLASAPLHGLTVQEFIMAQEPPACAGNPAARIAYSRERFAEYLANHRPTTAIMAYNEQVGIGIMAALGEKGYRVPQDVSLFGFDDIFAHVAVPAMTVVSLRLSDVGARAAELALEMSTGSKPISAYQGYQEWLPANLVVRSSTAAAPEKAP